MSLGLVAANEYTMWIGITWLLLALMVFLLARAVHVVRLRRLATEMRIALPEQGAIQGLPTDQDNYHDAPDSTVDAGAVAPLDAVASAWKSIKTGETSLQLDW